MAERGSRGGVVAAMVVFVVLFFVAGIFAVVQSTNASKYQKQLDDLNKRYADAVSSGELTEAKGLRGQGGGTAFGALKGQRDAVVELIQGRKPATENAADEAAKAFAQYVDDANKRLADAKANASIPTGSVKDAMNAMAQAVVQKSQDVNNLTDQLNGANEKLKQATDAYDAGIKQLRDQLTKAQGSGNEAQEAARKYREEKDAQLTKIQQDLVAAIQASGTTLEQVNQQLAGRNDELN